MQSFRLLGLPSNFGIVFGLMVVVVAEGGMDLCQRKVRIPFVDLFGAQPPAELVQHDLDHLDVGVVDPAAAAVVQHDVGGPRREPRLWWCHGTWSPFAKAPLTLAVGRRPAPNPRTTQSADLEVSRRTRG